MSRKAKRDIYKQRTATDFDKNRDVDLTDLRYLMVNNDIDDNEYDRYGLYVDNIIKILLTSSKFIGYSDDTKEDLRGRAMPDMILARTKFNGTKYPTPTAPFSYLYRIGFNAFCHELKDYYKMQNRMSVISELPPELQEEVSKMETDWELISDNLTD